MYVPHMLVHRAREREGQGVREREARKDAQTETDEAVWVRQRRNRCCLLWPL